MSALYQAPRAWTMPLMSRFRVESALFVSRSRWYWYLKFSRSAWTPCTSARVGASPSRRALSSASSFSTFSSCTLGEAAGIDAGTTTGAAGAAVGMEVGAPGEASWARTWAARRSVSGRSVLGFTFAIPWVGWRKIGSAVDDRRRLRPAVGVELTPGALQPERREPLVQERRVDPPVDVEAISDELQGARRFEQARVLGTVELVEERGSPVRDWLAVVLALPCGEAEPALHPDLVGAGAVRLLREPGGLPEEHVHNALHDLRVPRREALRDEQVGEDAEASVTAGRVDDPGRAALGEREEVGAGDLGIDVVREQRGRAVDRGHVHDLEVALLQPAALEGPVERELPRGPLEDRDPLPLEVLEAIRGRRRGDGDVDPAEAPPGEDELRRQAAGPRHEPRQVALRREVELVVRDRLVDRGARAREVAHLHPDAVRPELLLEDALVGDDRPGTASGERPASGADQGDADADGRGLLLGARGGRDEQEREYCEDPLHGAWFSVSLRRVSRRPQCNPRARGLGPGSPARRGAVRQGARARSRPPSAPHGRPSVITDSDQSHASGVLTERLAAPRRASVIADTQSQPVRARRARQAPCSGSRPSHFTERNDRDAGQRGARRREGLRAPGRAGPRDRRRLAAG